MSQSTSPSISSLLAERSRFTVAYQDKKITEEQYKQALAYNDAQLKAATPAPTTTTTTAPKTYTSTPVNSPLPTDPTSTPFRTGSDGAVFLDTDYNFVVENYGGGGETAPTPIIHAEPKPVEQQPPSIVVGGNIVNVEAPAEPVKDTATLPVPGLSNQLTETLKGNTPTVEVPISTPEPTSTAEPEPVKLPVSGLANQITATVENKSPTTVVEVTPTEPKVLDTSIPTNTPGLSNQLTNTDNAQDLKLMAEGAIIVGGAIIAPEITIPAIIAGEGLNIGIKSVATSIETGKATLVLPTSVNEVMDVAAGSVIFAGVGSGVIGGIAKVAPTLIATPVTGAVTRVGVNMALGGGGEAILSGGDPKAIGEGILFGAGLGLAGEVLVPVAGKVNSAILKTETGQNFANRLQPITDRFSGGSKFLEIKQVEETSIQTTEGRAVDITRITRPDTEVVTLKGNQAVDARMNLGNLDNAKIKMYGRENIGVFDESGSMTAGGSGLIEVTRPAKPILDTIGKSEFEYGKITQGSLGKDIPITLSPEQGVPTAIDVSAVGKTKMSSDKVWVDETANIHVEKNPVLITDKQITAGKDLGINGQTVTKRTFDTVQFEVKGKPNAPTQVTPSKANSVTELNFPDGLPAKTDIIDIADMYGASVGGKTAPKSFVDKTVVDQTNSPIREDFWNSQRANKSPEISVREYGDLTSKSSASKAGTNEAFSGAGYGEEQISYQEYLKLRPSGKPVTETSTVRPIIAEIPTSPVSNSFLVPPTNPFAPATKSKVKVEQDYQFNTKPGEVSRAIDSNSPITATSPITNVAENVGQNQRQFNIPSGLGDFGITSDYTPVITTPDQTVFPTQPTPTTPDFKPPALIPDRWMGGTPIIDTTPITEPDQFMRGTPIIDIGQTPEQPPIPIPDQQPIAYEQTFTPQTPKINTPKVFNLPTSGSFNSGWPSPSKGLFRRTKIGITEYPVVTAQEILGGIGKRKK